jgi:hypothetical protein
MKKRDETESETVENKESAEHNPDFFERLGNYGVQISRGVQSGIDKISPYFKTSPENLSEEDRKKLREEEEKKEEERKQEQQKEEDEKKKEEGKDFDSSNYWIVRIPIVNDDNVVPKNTYEKEEDKLKYLLRESLVEKRLGKSKEGSLYEMGGRLIRMCERVKEYEAPKIVSVLEGSKMSKWSKFTSE